VIPNDSIPPTKKLEKLTQDNVVRLLTAYGKLHPQTKVKFTTPYGTIVIQLFKDTPVHQSKLHLFGETGLF